MKFLLERRNIRRFTIYLDMLPHFNAENVILLTLRVVHSYLQWYLLSKNKMRFRHFNMQCLRFLWSKSKYSWCWRRSNFFYLVCSRRNKCVWIFRTLYPNFLWLAIRRNLKFLIAPVAVINRNKLCKYLVFKNYGPVIIFLKNCKAWSKLMRELNSEREWELTYLRLVTFWSQVK